MPRKRRNPKRPTEGTLIDTAQVALMCSVSVRTVEGWRHDGYGPPCVKLGKSVRYDPKKVQAWIDEREGRSTSDFQYSGARSG